MEKDLIEEKLQEHDRRLDKHDDKIEILEKNDAINSTKLDNLYITMEKLTSTLKWAIGFFIAGIITGTVSFVLFLIERLIK